MKEESEFGKGFIYNLVLFAKHFERFKECMDCTAELAERNPDLWKKGHDNMWFNGAADHFVEFEIPEQYKDTELGKLAQELSNEAWDRRTKITTQEDFDKFHERLEELCRLIDKSLGIEPVQATWN